MTACCRIIDASPCPRLWFESIHISMDRSTDAPMELSIDMFMDVSMHVPTDIFMEYS